MDKINDWDSMISGKLYNSSSKDLFAKHTLGMIRCDRFNRTPMWMLPLKMFNLKKLIPSSKGEDFFVFAPFYCEYCVNINVSKGCFVNYNCTFLDVAPITRYMSLQRKSNT